MARLDFVSIFNLKYFVLLIPSISILQLDYLKPAVSARLSRNPPCSIEVSIMSRVVPGISLTIDTSLRARQFIRVLLPEFGSPSIVTLIPSFVL